MECQSFDSTRKPQGTITDTDQKMQNLTDELTSIRTTSSFRQKIVNLHSTEVYYTDAVRYKESGQQKAFLISDKRTHVSVPLLPLVTASPVVQRAAEGHCYCQEVCISVPDFSHQTLQLLSDFVSGKEINGTFADIISLKDLCCILGVNHGILSAPEIPLTPQQAPVEPNDDMFVPVPMNEYCLQDMVKEEDCSSQNSFGLEDTSDLSDVLSESGTTAEGTGMCHDMATEKDVNTWKNVSVASSSAENSHNYTEQDMLEMDADEEHSVGETHGRTEKDPVPNVLQSAEEADAFFLPEKSRPRYEREYEEFSQWRTKKGLKIMNEDVILAYTNEKSKKYAPTSLWTKMSMLRKCLQVKEKVEFSSFGKIQAYLASKAKEYKPKKSKILSGEQVKTFLKEAEDEQHLLEKVILIFGIFGPCRTEELLSLSVDDIEDTGQFAVITLKDTKNCTSRNFVIKDTDCDFKPYSLLRKYIALRPDGAVSKRFFLRYHNGKCKRQHVGIHTIGGTPRKIAQYLGLEHADMYTGHAFRRSSVTMVPDARGDLLTVKRLGGWKSSSVTEVGYAEEPMQKKIKTTHI